MSLAIILSDRHHEVKRQKWLIDAVRSRELPQKSECFEHVVSNQVDPHRVLQTWQTRILEQLDEQFRHQFPMILSMLGESMFQQCCRDFWFEQPSSSSDWSLYGQKMPAWFESRADLMQLHPAVADVARLDWYVYWVSHEIMVCPHIVWSLECR